MGRTAWLLISCAALLALATNSIPADEKTPAARTVGDVIGQDVMGLEGVTIEGIGLIAELDDTGSDPPPSDARNQLLAEMQKRGVENAESVLRSTRTAMVVVRGSVPPGARKGDHFDVEVSILPRDQAKSLAGGWLLDTLLTEKAAVEGGGVLSGRVLGKASGAVLLAPSTDSKAVVELRRGRILGGGTSKIDRDFTLVTDSSHRSARFTMEVAKRINERYRNPGRDAKPIAEPKDKAQISLRVPSAYRQNISRYLAVIRRVPLWQTASSETLQLTRLTELEAELLAPATARDSAMHLEAIGPRGIPALRKGLLSTDPDVRFFSAEALAYLGEPAAADELAATARGIPEYRAHALTALGSLDESVARIRLRELLNDPNSAELRYGAFRALNGPDDRDRHVRHEVIDDSVHIYQPDTTGPPIVHVLSRGRAEIVLFGADMKLLAPLHLKVGRDIMLSSSDAESGLILSAFSARHPGEREVMGLEIVPVIRRAMALGATYPDIVGMLTMAEKNHNLPGRLVIDAYPDSTRIYSRLNRLSPAPPTEAVAMPNLFQWFERSGRPKPKTPDLDATAGNLTEEKKYLTKPNLFDRLLRRSAN